MLFQMMCSIFLTVMPFKTDYLGRISCWKYLNERQPGKKGLTEEQYWAHLMKEHKNWAWKVSDCLWYFVWFVLFYEKYTAKLFSIGEIGKWELNFYTAAGVKWEVYSRTHRISVVVSWKSILKMCLFQHKFKGLLVTDKHQEPKNQKGTLLQSNPLQCKCQMRGPYPF